MAHYQIPKSRLAAYYEEPESKRMKTEQLPSKWSSPRRSAMAASGELVATIRSGSVWGARPDHQRWWHPGSSPGQASSSEERAPAAAGVLCCETRRRMRNSTEVALRQHGARPPRQRALKLGPLIGAEIHAGLGEVANGSCRDHRGVVAVVRIPQVPWRPKLANLELTDVEEEGADTGESQS
jgi:hypothetical protein